MSQIEPNENEKPTQEFVFMKEQIKERPFNRRKLVKRTLVTASMAVVFGMVACLTFLLLEPLINNLLHPKEPPKIVEFPEETEEMLPEDMLITDKDEEAESNTSPTVITQNKELEITDYQMLYGKLYEMAKEVSKSVVTVTGVTSDIDWFNAPFESKRSSAGVIVADNGREYLILTESSRLEQVESINVTFSDGTKAQARLSKTDPTTGLSVIAVTTTQLSKETRAEITIATLGNSNAASLLGAPVIAIGSPLGTGNSILYGTVTSIGMPLNLVDSSYKLITTDMYASKNASGVLVTMNGRVVGILDMSYNSKEMENLLSAIGISELKKTVEILSNSQDKAYLGIYGTDVTWDAYNNLHVPLGAYVTAIEMDSPAMQVGIQSGDVIVRIGETEIASYGEYINVLNKLVPEVPVVVTVKRQVAEEYKDVEIEVTTSAIQ